LRISQLEKFPKGIWMSPIFLSPRVWEGSNVCHVMSYYHLRRLAGYHLSRYLPRYVFMIVMETWIHESVSGSQLHYYGLASAEQPESTLLFFFFFFFFYYY
jgi:hypothetical protein